MPSFRDRKTDQLVGSRFSYVGCFYFLTLCTTNREKTLCVPETVTVMNEQLRSQSEDGDFSLLMGVFMPDHIHLLVELGNRLPLSSVVGKFKTKTKQMLPNKLRWQRNYFEHRLKEKDRLEAFGFYVFMNPYRAELVKCSEVWKHFICNRPEYFSFMEKRMGNGCPQDAWLSFDEGISTEVRKLMD